VNTKKVPYFVSCRYSLTWAEVASLLKFLDCTNLLGLLCKGDQLVAEATAYKTHNKKHRRTYVPSVGFEPAIPGIEQLKACASDRTVTGRGLNTLAYLITFLVAKVRYMTSYESRASSNSIQQGMVEV